MSAECSRQHSPAPTGRARPECAKCESSRFGMRRRPEPGGLEPRRRPLSTSCEGGPGPLADVGQVARVGAIDVQRGAVGQTEEAAAWHSAAQVADEVAPIMVEEVGRPMLLAVAPAAIVRPRPTCGGTLGAGSG
eukprot:scaffold40592_cov63-Phaeocystis_antarctica.AAC.4